MNTAKRIKAGLLAFAAGDAAGVPWEGMTPNSVDARLIEHVPQRPYAPRGATSDDTEQTLIVAEYLLKYGAQAHPQEFLTMMSSGVTGCGRATWESLQRFKTTGELWAARGSSNGAAMRIMPVGWAIRDDELRRQVATTLSATTHGKRQALVCACIMAAMANASLEDGATINTVINAALAELSVHELRWFNGDVDSTLHMNLGYTAIPSASEGGWHPPDFMTTDALITIANIIHVLRITEKAGEGAAYGIKQAIALGGDTDTVAALAAGVLGAISGDVSDIRWFHIMQPVNDVYRIAEGLADLRTLEE